MSDAKTLDTYAPLSLEAEKKYHPELDGLRGVSILLVFLSHYGLPLLPGAFGVTVFFFVSGFLITRLLQVEMNRAGSVTFGDFYMRRFLRLGPALMVFILVFGVLWNYLFDVFIPSSISAAVFYYFNYHKILADEVFRPYGVLWSLAIEEHFYLIFPLTLVFLKGCSRLLLQVLIAIVVIALVWRFLIFFMITHDHINVSLVYLKKATDTRLDAIAYGCLLATMASYERSKALVQRMQNWQCGVIGVLLIVIGLAFKLPQLSHLSAISGLQYTLRYSFTGLGLFLVLNYVLFAIKAKQYRAWLAQPLLVYVGKVSYSLYLWHLAILVTAFELYPDAPRIKTYVICAFISLAAAMASYHFIELKFVAMRRKYGSAVLDR